MRTQQPNFEKIKTALFNAVLFSPQTDMAILLETVAQKKMLPYFQHRKESLKQDLEKWLDGVDIRCVGGLIDATVELSKNHGLPSWMTGKKFIIDYNNHGMLDLHKAAFVTNG